MENASLELVKLPPTVNIGDSTEADIAIFTDVLLTKNRQQFNIKGKISQRENENFLEVDFSQLDQTQNNLLSRNVNMIEVAISGNPVYRLMLVVGKDMSKGTQTNEYLHKIVTQGIPVK